MPAGHGRMVAGPLIVSLGPAPICSRGGETSDLTSV